MPDQNRTKPSLAQFRVRQRFHERTIREFLTAAALQKMERVRHYVETQRLHPDATTGSKPTAICYAAMKCNPEMVAYLLQRGAGVNSCAALGMTPLHYAAMGGCEMCVSTLIHRNARLCARNQCGETPLSIAERHPRGALCRELLARHSASRNPDSPAKYRFH